MLWTEWRAHVRLLLEENREARREEEGDGSRARVRASSEVPLYPEGPPLEGYGKPPSDATRRQLPGYTERPDLN
jgi:hypothetical protein